MQISALWTTTAKTMMTSSDYEKLLKLVNLLSSDQDGEALNAVKAAGRILNGHGLAWNEILLPRKLLPVRINPQDSSPTSGAAGDAPPPLGQATLQQMLNLLMRGGNVPPDIKRELREHEQPIRENKLRSTIRGEIQAMYSYAVLHNRRL